MREKAARKQGGTSIASRTSRLVLLFVSALVGLWALLGGAQPAYSQSVATVKVWNITGPIGHNPDVSREDVTGVTSHVNTATNPLSVAVAIDNSTNPEGPCGLIFWNPATNNFVDYGFGGGFADGIDINFNAPSLTGPSGGVFGAPTFGPGDTWETISGPFNGSFPLFVNFKGSNNFRNYTVGSGGVRGVRVDQSNGRIFFADGGTLNQLDPSTNTVTTWFVGGSPYYLTLDSSGNVFATVATAGVTDGRDAIVELTPGSGRVKAWPIPGGGLAPGFVELAANGIALDSAGNVWFGETASNEVGRLNPSSNEICKFTQAGLTASPQQVASSGFTSTLQAFYTEAGAGFSGSDLQGAVSVLTQASAVPEVSPCPMPAPTVVTVTPSTSTASFTDIVHTPRFNAITPLVTMVTGTSTPGIVRFPMPFPTGGTTTAPNSPSGMTGIALPGTVLGSYQAPGFPFTPNSAVFEVQSPVITATQTQTVTQTFTPTQPTQNYIYNSNDPANEHSIKFTTTVNNSFTLSVSATEVDGHGVCVIPGTGNANDSPNFDCRLANFFGVGQSPGPSTPPFNPNQTVLVPRCGPYSHDHCVVYHVVNAPPSPGQAGSPYASPVYFYIAYNATVPTFSGYLTTLDMFDDPSDDANACQCYPTITGTPPRVFPYSPEDGQFVFDITTYFNPQGKAGQDSGVGGKGRSFNDFVLAYPLAPAQTSTFSWVQPLSSSGNPSFPNPNGQQGNCNQGNSDCMFIRFTLSNPNPAGTALVSPNHVGVAILSTTHTCAQDASTNFVNASDVRQPIQTPSGSPTTIIYDSSQGRYQYNVLLPPPGLYKVIATSNLFPQQCANFTVNSQNPQ